LKVPLKPDFIIEWSSGTERYYELPFRVPLSLLK